MYIKGFNHFPKDSGISFGAYGLYQFIEGHYNEGVTLSIDDIYNYDATAPKTLINEWLQELEMLGLISKKEEV